ncbi:MAG: hypothetical protein ACI9WU_003258 [Myxococcota bacterium]|jgi:hypothetical protein
MMAESSRILRLFDVAESLSDTREELASRVRWIIRVRFLVVAGVLATMFFTGWQGLTRQPELTRSTLTASMLTGALAFGLNIAYGIRLRHAKDLRAFVLLQLVVDVAIFSSFVYRTGGVTSPFTFLFMLPVIAAAMLVSGRASAAVATWATVCYSALSILGALGVVEHVSYFVALDQFAGKWSYVVLMTLVNPLAFYAVAGLTTFLMNAVHEKGEKLRYAHQRLDRRAHFLDMLYQVTRAGARAQGSDESLDAVGQILVEGLTLDRCLLYLVNDAGDKLELAQVFHHPRLPDKTTNGLSVAIELQDGAGITARCAMTRTPENVLDPTDHPLIDRALAERIGLNPFAVAPLVAGGALLGVIGIDRSQDNGVIDQEAFELFTAFADQAANVLR